MQGKVPEVIYNIHFNGKPIGHLDLFSDDSFEMRFTKDATPHERRMIAMRVLSVLSVWKKIDDSAVAVEGAG